MAQLAADAEDVFLTLTTKIELSGSTVSAQHHSLASPLFS